MSLKRKRFDLRAWDTLSVEAFLEQCKEHKVGALEICLYLFCSHQIVRRVCMEDNRKSTTSWYTPESEFKQVATRCISQLSVTEEQCVWDNIILQCPTDNTYLRTKGMYAQSDMIQELSLFLGYLHAKYPKAQLSWPWDRALTLVEQHGLPQRFDPNMQRYTILWTALWYSHFFHKVTRFTISSMRRMLFLAQGNSLINKGGKRINCLSNLRIPIPPQLLPSWDISQLFPIWDFQLPEQLFHALSHQDQQTLEARQLLGYTLTYETLSHLESLLHRSVGSLPTCLETPTVSQQENLQLLFQILASRRTTLAPAMFLTAWSRFFGLGQTVPDYLWTDLGWYFRNMSGEIGKEKKGYYGKEWGLLADYFSESWGRGLNRIETQATFYDTIERHLRGVEAAQYTPAAQKFWDMIWTTHFSLLPPSFDNTNSLYRLFHLLFRKGIRPTQSQFDTFALCRNIHVQHALFAACDVVGGKKGWEFRNAYPIAHMRPRETFPFLPHLHNLARRSCSEVFDVGAEFASHLEHCLQWKSWKSKDCSIVKTLLSQGVIVTSTSHKAIVESKNQTLMQIHRDEFTAMRAEMLDSLCSDVADMLMEYIGWAKPVY